MSLYSNLTSEGFALRREFSQSDLLNAALTLGTPVAEPRDGVIVKPLRAVAGQAAPTNTLSSRYGAGAFPLHTEAAYWRQPPRFLLLYCVSPGTGEHDTLIQDGDALLHVPEAAVLKADPWMVSAGINPFLCTVLSELDRDRPLIRFDRDCMQPAIRVSSSESVVHSFLGCATPYSHRWQAGDLLIFDNWRILHGRGAAARVDHGRLLLKVMVK